MHPFELKFSESWPPPAWEGVSVILGVSGGADSMAMLRAVHALKSQGIGRLIVAHFNHRLRGPESDADEAFVGETAARLGLPLELGHAATGGIRPRSGEGLESAARRARYRFLGAAAARLGARYVATAHTADDQAETILHRILRGTGIGGLAGMSRVRTLPPAATLIRPCLGFRREELRAYLAQIGQPYREDSSNRDPAWTRNRIRLQLLPELAARFNPGVVDALLRLGTLAGEVQQVVDQRADELSSRAVRQESAAAVRIDLKGLRAQPRYIVRELIMAAWRRQGWPLGDMGFQQWDLLAAMALSEACRSEPAPDRHAFPGGVRARVEDCELRLSRGLGGQSSDCR